MNLTGAVVPAASRIVRLKSQLTAILSPDGDQSIWKLEYWLPQSWLTRRASLEIERGDRSGVRRPGICDPAAVWREGPGGEASSRMSSVGSLPSHPSGRGKGHRMQYWSCRRSRA